MHFVVVYADHHIVPCWLSLAELLDFPRCCVASCCLTETADPTWRPPATVSGPWRERWCAAAAPARSPSTACPCCTTSAGTAAAPATRTWHRSVTGPADRGTGQSQAPGTGAQVSHRLRGPGHRSVTGSGNRGTGQSQTPGTGAQVSHRLRGPGHRSVTGSADRGTGQSQAPGTGAQVSHRLRGPGHRSVTGSADRGTGQSQAPRTGRGQWYRAGPGNRSAAAVGVNGSPVLPPALL